MKKFRTLSLLVAAYVATTGFAPSQDAKSALIEGPVTPVVLVPSSSELYQGDSVLITLTLSGNAPSNQTYPLSSNSPYITVPSSATVLSGHSSVSFYATAPTGFLSRAALRSAVATVSAAFSNSSISTDLTVDF